MKNLYALSFFAISSLSFSFYKLEKIYWDSDSYLYESKVVSPSDWEKEILNKPSSAKFTSFFLYDQHTFIQLHINTYIEMLPEDAKQEELENIIKSQSQHLKFLNLNFTDNKNQETIDMIQLLKFRISNISYRRQPLVFQEDGSIQREYTRQFWEKIDEIKNLNTPYQRIDLPNFKPSPYEKLKSYLYARIDIQEELTSHSQVKITNTGDKVKLTKSGKQVDLTAALKSYFVKDISDLEPQDLAHIISSKEPLSQKQLVPKLNLHHYNRKSLNRESYDLLQNSTILAVWTLIPQYTIDTEEVLQVKEAEMIGLARDERTKQLYHWTTDLGQDISILMNYPDNNKIL